MRDSVAWAGEFFEERRRLGAAIESDRLGEEEKRGRSSLSHHSPSLYYSHQPHIALGAKRSHHSLSSPQKTLPLTPEVIPTSSGKAENDHPPSSLRHASTLTRTTRRGAVQPRSERAEQCQGNAWLF